MTAMGNPARAAIVRWRLAGAARAFTRSAREYAAGAAGLDQRLFHVLLDQSDLPPLVVLGDSHSKVYGQPAMLLHGVVPVWAPFLAASARGLGNPTSLSGSGERLRGLVEGIDSLRPPPVLLCFGQVDLEFVYYFDALRDGVPAPFDQERMTGFVRDTVDRYVRYAQSLQTSARVYVATILPPVLGDQAIRTGYINAHVATLHASMSLAELRDRIISVDFPDLRARTRIHADFNERLMAACREADLPTLDVFSLLVGADGLALPVLRWRHGGTDHHVSAIAALRLVRHALTDQIVELQRS